MTASRTQMQKDKETFAAQMKEKVNKLDLDLKEKQQELKKLDEEFTKVDKQNKQLLMEREKMKQRLGKLKSKKYKGDQNEKICK